MSLADYEFSDLLLFPGGNWRLKGCPSTGQKLVPLPQDCREEAAAMLHDLPIEFVKKRVNPLPADDEELPDEQAGSLDGAARSRSIRYCHNGIQYRVAATQDVTGEFTFFLRRLPAKVPEFSELGIPPHLVNWLLEPESLQGLILVTGAQAAGKSTTAAALTVARLAKWGGHGLTLECPAELPVVGAWGEYGFCIQTEINSEHELARQIECAHRFSSPNVILIGEIRTKYAAVEALRIAQTSSKQVVIATAFGLDLLTALGALLKGARELDGESAAQNLANCLLCVIHQELLNVDGHSNLHAKFLLVPFGSEGDAIRVKIRDGRLLGLQDDMREQNYRIGFPSFPSGASGPSSASGGER